VLDGIIEFILSQLIPIHTIKSYIITILYNSILSSKLKLTQPFKFM
jgi:hypothetical protein